jgi:hypothetical protein
VPDGIQLPSNRNIEVSVQGAIQGPLLHIETGVGFAELSNANFNAFKNSILNLSHFTAHWHLQLDHFRLAMAFQGFGHRDLKPWP